MRGKRALVKTLTGLAFAFSLIGLSVKSANAEIPILPIQFQIISHPRDDKSSQTTRQSNPQQPQKTKSESASVPQKHYNWIKPNKYRDWQCAYELLYNGERPYGFKLYVDRDGDNKPDEEFKYNIMHIRPFFNGIEYKYELDWDQLRVGGGWRKDLASALNVCGIEAMRKIFYLRGDTVSDPEDFEMGEPDLEKTYPSITFYK